MFFGAVFTRCFEKEREGKVRSIGEAAVGI
jgi:hypothetical protein